MGMHANGPKGLKQAAVRPLLCLSILCLPYYQALLYAGMSGVLSVLLLSILLMIAVSRSPEIYRAITSCLKALPLGWAMPAPHRCVRWAGPQLFVVAAEPSLAPSFQRPPPLFS